MNFFKLLAKDFFSAELIKLTLPIAASNWIYSAQGFLSLLIISSLGGEVIAGVGLASTLLWLIYGADEAVYTGVAVMVAREIGRGRRAGRFVLYSLALSLAISGAVWIFGGEFLKIFCKVFRVEEGVERNIKEFFVPVSAALPLILSTNGLNALFNGAGRTKEIFRATAVSACVNLGILALGTREMGALGAGVAFTAGEVAALIYYFFRLKGDERLNPLRDLKFELKEAAELVKLGFPTGIEEGVSSLSFNVFSGLVAGCGTEVLAGYQIGLKVEGIAAAVGFALADASLPFIGQSLGRSVRKRVRELSLTAVGMGTLLGLFLIGAGPLLVDIFSAEREVKEWAKIYLIFAGANQPGYNLSAALSGALRALGETGKSAAVNVSSFWALRLIPSWLVLRWIKSPAVPWTFAAIETAVRTAVLKAAVERSLKRFKGGAL